MDKEIHITGRVQGVGFRPFIYNLANRLHLKGKVFNDGSGVVIRVKGQDAVINEFVRQIPVQKPIAAQIAAINIKKIPTEKTSPDFRIVHTPTNNSINIPLTPDFALCKSCAAEILDKNNRRYFYPFTTCTQCGPRYSITQKFPFERENTSLAEYKMCPDCYQEYISPGNKRFHSQTNTCNKCGVSVSFTNNQGTIFSGNNETLFSLLVSKLAAGKIIAVKNTAGYLLLCDATNTIAIQELRNRKHRPTKPFAVLFNNLAQIEDHLFVQEIEAKALSSSIAPIVILPVKNKNNLATDAIAPEMDSIGAMLPNSGLLLLIAQLFKKPLIATSGNQHGTPISADEKEAGNELKNIADYFLHHTMPILHPQDDSVLRFSRVTKTQIILRRARGMSPNSPISALQNNFNKKILCLGSDLKSTITVVPNRYGYTSEYLGNLNNYDTFKRYSHTIKGYQEIFNFNPELILCDKHPLFESRNIITQFPNIKVIKIQHHEAHFAAILQEHNLWHSKENILGVIWDGTGFAEPQRIWGGEFFTYFKNKIIRVAHFQQYPWILGDKMALTPKISALSIGNCNPQLRPYFTETEWKFYSSKVHNEKMQTSSIGRLFDAVAFVLGFHQVNSFEGEASMYLEKKGSEFYQKNSDFKPLDYLKDEIFSTIIPIQLLFIKIMEAKAAQINTLEIAFCFHYTLVCCIKKLANYYKCKKLAFSGGVFQNALLVDMIIKYLGKSFELYFHRELSPNDENISFGQLCHYLNIGYKEPQI